MPNDAIFEVVDSLSNDDLEIVAESPEQIMLLDNPYIFSFQFASKTTYGVVKIGDNIDVTNGVISISGDVGVQTYLEETEPELLKAGDLFFRIIT